LSIDADGLEPLHQIGDPRRRGPGKIEHHGVDPVLLDLGEKLIETRIYRPSVNVRFAASALIEKRLDPCRRATLGFDRPDQRRSVAIAAIDGDSIANRTALRKSRHRRTRE
jgi:hypothetical protein